MSNEFDARDAAWVKQNEAKCLGTWTPKPQRWCEMSRVYFIQDGDAIKIGIGLDPDRRMKDLQAGNPRKLSLIGSYIGTDELALHKKFAEYRIHREWFRDNSELRALIAAKCPANDNQVVQAAKVA